MHEVSKPHGGYAEADNCGAAQGGAILRFSLIVAAEPVRTEARLKNSQEGIRLIAPCAFRYEGGDVFCVRPRQRQMMGLQP